MEFHGNLLEFHGNLLEFYGNLLELLVNQNNHQSIATTEFLPLRKQDINKYLNKYLNKIINKSKTRGF